MKIIKRKNRLTAHISELAGDYKYRGLSRREAWNQFIQDRNLKPEVDAKELMSKFDEAIACPLDTEKDVQFEASHFDNLRSLKCQINVVDGVYKIIWADGSTGSNPPSLPPNENRFTPLS